MKVTKFLFILFLVCGCNMKVFSAKMTVEVLKDGMVSFEEEPDEKLAEVAAMANVKMLEGILQVIPENEDLLFVLTQTFSSLAFIFLERDIEALDDSAEEEIEKLSIRATGFYERSKAYGFKLMELKHPGFQKKLKGSQEEFEKELQKFGKKDVPLLFWVAYSIAGGINLNQDDPARIILLPKVDAMMNKVLEMDESYYYGGPHLYFGGRYASLPVALGGEPEKSREHLEAAIRLTEGKFLLPKFFLARYYAVAVQDRELFQKTLEEVIDTPPDIFPRQRLVNTLMISRAKIWIGKMKTLF